MVISTTAQLSSKSYLGIGTIVETLGKVTTSDQGGGRFEILENAALADNGNNIIGMGGSKYAVLRDQLYAEHFGMVADVIEINNASLSTSGTLSLLTATFSSADVGKKIYLRDVYSLAATYEAYIGLGSYKGNVANYSSLPGSPLDRDLYRVDDASDDSSRGLSGVQYYWYYATQGRWIYLIPFQADTYTITAYNSPTSVTIDYSPPVVVNNLSGYFGSDNTPAFQNYLSYCESNNLFAQFRRGKYLIHLDASGTSRISIGSTSGSNWGIMGEGKFSTNFYVTYESDKGGTDLLELANDNIFPIVFLEHIDAVGTAANNIRFQGFSVLMNDDQGYRRTDSDQASVFLFSSGFGRIEMEDVSTLGGSEAFKITTGNSGGFQAYLENVLFTGGRGSEICLGLFGARKNYISINNFLIDSWGDTQEFSFNGKARGISGYIHPELACKVTNGTIRNVADRWQFFSSSGADFAYDGLTDHQIFSNVTFLADGITCLMAIYTSRVYTKGVYNKIKIEERNGGSFDNGIWARNSCTISDSSFEAGIWLSTISNNNVFTENTEIRISNCHVFKGQTDVYPNELGNAQVHLYISDSTFYDLDTGDQHFRLLGGTNSNAKVFVSNCSIKGQGPSNAEPIVFCESGANVDIEFHNCYMPYQNLAGNTFLVKQLRDNCTIRLFNCYGSYPLVFDLDVASSTPLIGARNDFPSYIINNATGLPVKFQANKRASATDTTDLDGQIVVTLDGQADYNWANAIILGDNGFGIDIISVSSTALTVRVKDSAGLDVPSVSVSFNYEIDQI